MPTKSAKNTEQLVIRVPRELVKALDKAVDRKREELPGITINRSDVVREILLRELKTPND